MNFYQFCVPSITFFLSVKREILESALTMVNWFSLLARAMIPNQGSDPGLISKQDESRGYNPQSRFPVSSSNPFFNNRMMIMMMLEKMRVSGKLSNKNGTIFLARAQ